MQHLNPALNATGKGCFYYICGKDGGMEAEEILWHQALKSVPVLVVRERSIGKRRATVPTGHFKTL